VTRDTQQAVTSSDDGKGASESMLPLRDSEITREALIERLALYRLAYREVRDALASLPCTSPVGSCEARDAAGEITDPEEWCVRCAALGNANDLVCEGIVTASQSRIDEALALHPKDEAASLGCAGTSQGARVAVDVLNVPVMGLVLTSLRELAELVDEQAEDDALWALNLDGTLPISEAYLQQELRRLHAKVEATVGVAKDALR
jgi:hypothetical protein